MSRLTATGALRITNPEKWEALVKREMKRVDGRLDDAARALGVSKRQLQRWLADLPDVERRAPGRPWPSK